MPATIRALVSAVDARRSTRGRTGRAPIGETPENTLFQGRLGHLDVVEGEHDRLDHR
jgi:hypothetical protein